MQRTSVATWVRLVLTFVVTGPFATTTFLLAAAWKTNNNDNNSNDDELPVLIHTREPIVLDNGIPAVTMIRPKIAGGTLATEGEFPWYISPTLGNFCGASLIHANVALTAAHCHVAFTPGRQVYVGALVRGTPAAGALERRVKRVLPHPLYNPQAEQQQQQQQENDIMLIQLDEPIPADQVTPVVYNTNPNLPVTNEPVVVMGFGRTAADEDPTFDLQRTTLFATENNVCQDIYANLFQEQLMLCAGDVNNPTSACQGDSGGPLVSIPDTTTDEDLNAVPVQYGVVSFGLAERNRQPVNACGNPDIPTVYMRVSTYADWITAAICVLSDTPPANVDCSTLPGDNLDIILPSLAPTPATVAPTPASLTADLTFVVQYDANPQETDFYILTADTGLVISSRPGGGPAVNSYSRIGYQIDDFPQGSYYFVVVDSGRDGMGSGIVPGFVNVYQHVENMNGTTELVLIAFGEPDFESSLEIPFNVTEFPKEVFKPTLSPTVLQPTVSPQPTRAPVVPTLRPTRAPALGNRPGFSEPSDNRDDNVDDDQEEEKDLLGLGLDETMTLIVLAAVALIVVVLFVMIARCLCCGPKGNANQRQTAVY